jgi:hypothetical protein
VTHVLCMEEVDPTCGYILRRSKPIRRKWMRTPVLENLCVSLRPGSGAWAKANVARGLLRIEDQIYPSALTITRR